MKKFMLLLIMILLITSFAYSQYPRNQQIQAAEYFLNSDPGEGHGNSINITTSPDVTINLNNLDVPVGTKIYVRFQSTNGFWSAPRCITRLNYFVITGATLQYGEYFINTDPGQGNGTQIDFASGTANVNDQNLQQGDVVYFRIRDSYNRWSPARSFKYQFKEMRRADYRIRLASTGNYTTPLILATTASPDNTCPYSCNKNNITWHKDDSIFVRYQTMEGFYSNWVNGVVADAGIDQTICQGTIATLTATGGQSYQWSDGQAGSTINVAPDVTTTYVVTVSSGPWITSIDSVIVYVLPGPPTPVITPTGNTTFCQGNSVILNSSTGSGYTYQWMRNNTIINGAINSSYTATQSGSYTVVVTSGCSSTSSPVIITVNSIPPTPVISQNGNVLSSTAPTGNQWYLNSTIIPGATNQTLNAAENGTYFVIVTLNDCISDTSNIITYTGIGESNSVYNISIYPNPNCGVFQIICDIHAQKEVSFKVIDYQGKPLFYAEPKQYFGKIEKTLQLQGLPSGIYKLIVIIDNETITRNFVIQK
jgi:hypothetical protein